MNNVSVDREPNLNGPESVPLKDFVKTFKMLVTVYDGDNVLREEVIDFGNQNHKAWLGKVTFWAVSNGFVVETSKPD